jgi:acyl-CoA thioester hydrolase
MNLLADYSFVMPHTVAWGDMDAMRHVNNTVYFRYFEHVRIAYIDSLGWDKIEDETGIGPILKSTAADFRRAVTYPDKLWLAARILLPLGDDRFTMEYAIASEGHNAITTIGTSVIVSFDYRNQKKAAIPALIRERIEAKERL